MWCGATGNLHVAHILSVADGLKQGATEKELNDDANLVCLCEVCNLGLGSRSMPFRMAVSLVSLRMAIMLIRAEAGPSSNEGNTDGDVQ
jgi:hypothetical protein